MKLEKLLQKARMEAPPEPPPGFENRVLRALSGQEPTTVTTLSLFDQLSALFPRLALVSALVMVLCFGVELLTSSSGQSDLTSSLAQLSDQWLFATKGF